MALSSSARWLVVLPRGGARRPVCCSPAMNYLPHLFVPAAPEVYTVHPDMYAALQAPGDIPGATERPPRQEPLFVIPPPAAPSGWTIEFRYREGEFNWRTGEPQTGEWQHHGTYRCRISLKKTLRRLRYGQGIRKQFRVRVTLWDYNGDIVFTGPDGALIGPS